MRITIQTPSGGALQLEANRELQRAFAVLHHADIRTRGGGQFADSAITIILARDADALKALAVLKLAGIRALPS